MRAAAVAAVLASGCSALVGIGDATYKEPAPDAGPPATVTGTFRQRWYPDNGQPVITDVPRDYSTMVVGAAIRDGSAAGGFRRQIGTAAHSGFTIPDVPPGAPYYLLTNLSGAQGYLLVDQHSIMNEFAALGRPNPALATQLTRLTLEADKMTAWTDNDSFALFCSNVDVVRPLPSVIPILGGEPAAGATSVSMDVDWSQVDNSPPRARRSPLIDGNAGDRLVLQHITLTESSTMHGYATTTEFVEFPPFTQVDGKAGRATGSFASTPVEVHYTVKGATFYRYLADVHPDAILLGGFDTAIAIVVQPGIRGENLLISAGPPVIMISFYNPEPNDINFGPMTFARPPAAWGIFYAVNQGAGVTRSTPVGMHTAKTSMLTLLPFTGSATTADLGPRISPPRRPQIGGMNFYDPQTIALNTSSPPLAVTWEPPALGTPTTYTLNIYHLTKDKDTAQVVETLVAFLRRPASGQTLDIPWDAFPSAGVYYMSLVAIEEKRDARQMLEDGGPPSATAAALSGILTLQ